VKFINVCTVLFVILFLSGDLLASPDKRVLNAHVATEKIIIDGKLTENEWDIWSEQYRFTQVAPQPGMPSGQRTAIRILYDDEAVYVGAMIYEEHADSIVRQLSPRDEFENSNTDAFGVTFDTYLDRQNATEFIVTAAGVQTDAIVKFDNVDRSWNAAWYSRVSLNDSGWSVEMKIPYSALRFPKKEIQTWGINFVRIIRRSRERSFWNEISPAIQNRISQSGILQGIHKIKAPIRLALLPYMSSYVEDYNGSVAKSLNGGMDVKYGLNESFTLDMTLVPDFGQTLFDNRVLNLSPIEVRYDERRYFFTEGVDLFNKNDLFYSRRVGGTPVNLSNIAVELKKGEIVTKNPANSRLYNAAKISGRNRRNTGIGFFNAVSAETKATVLDTISNIERSIQTSPLTNYNVIVVDQALKNNSFVSIVNTNVKRWENSYDANVSAVLFRLADKKNKYAISGSTDVSQLFYKSTTDIGYRSALTLGKQSGNYTWSLNTKAVSDRFNANDLGYLDRNNIISCLYNNIYNTYKPFWVVNTTYNKIGMEYYRAFNPDVFAKAAIHGNHVVTFTNFLSSGLYWDAQPGVSYDYFEPRTPGRYYVLPANNMNGGFISSDYRKRFALDLEASKRWFGGSNRQTEYWSISPRYRFSNKLSAIYSLTRENKANDVGYVNKISDSIYLGTRMLNTTINTLSTAYVFKNNISLKLDARHYWSQADYSRYDLLATDGRLNNSNYNKNHNVNYNSFNVFMNFVWQFKPGSEMSVVYQNSIYSSGQNLIPDYVTDLRTTLQAPQSNSVSVKIIYFLDYLTIDKAVNKKKGNES